MKGKLNDIAIALALFAAESLDQRPLFFRHVFNVFFNTVECRVVAILKFNLPLGLNIQLFICPSEVVATLKFKSWLEFHFPNGKIF